MTKLGTLKIVNGDFNQGFRVIFRIGEDGSSTATEFDGWLPSAPQLPQLCSNWHSSYCSGGETDSQRALSAPAAQVTNFSILDSADDLAKGINNWLNSDDTQFRPFRDKLLRHLPSNEQIRFIIQTDNLELWRLPWELWDVIRECEIEPIISASEYNQVQKPPIEKPKNQVRILVILGNDNGIDIERDLASLQQELPDAYIHPLRNPQKEQLSSELWEQKWDILFFAGHSWTQEDLQGRFSINRQEILTIEELKLALTNAIKHGLKLAIFNSCDGLGLAYKLVGLQIPATIVMRERVPDKVAQKFLAYFLKPFAQEGNSLSDSVWQARQRLRELEKIYPCASWLPMICQNPAEVMPTWQSLLGRSSPFPQEHQHASVSESEHQELEKAASIKVGLEVPVSAVDSIFRFFIRYKRRAVAFCLLGTISSLGLRFVVSPMLNEVGQAQYNAHQLNNARFFWELSLKLNPDNDSACNNLGILDEDFGELEVAIQKFQDCKQKNPIACSKDAQFDIIRDGNYEKAENQLRSCFGLAKTDDEKHSILKNLGWALLEQDKYNQAEAKLQDAIALDSQQGSAHCLLAKTLEAQGHQENALEKWEYCLRFSSRYIPEENQWIDEARQRRQAKNNNQ